MDAHSFLLETNRLLIRRFTDEDLETFLAYRNDPEVARYQGWNLPYPREKGLEFIEEMKIKDPNEPGGWLQLAVIVKETGEFIGDAAFYFKKDENSRAFIGCTIMQDHWHKGYGVEATRRVMAYLFDELKVHRIVAETDVKNQASINTLERLGFRREGHFVENVWHKGNWASEYHFALLEREWKSIAAA